MHQSRLQYLTFVTLSALLSAAGCTPQSPKKNQPGGECKVNSDCGSNLCVKNRCAAKIECADEGNELLPQCEAIQCADNSMCPGSKYYCDGSVCVYGDQPQCLKSSDCKPPLRVCVIDDKDPSKNICRICQGMEGCEDGFICEKNKCKLQVQDCKNDEECTDPMLSHCANTGDKICVACNQPKDCGDSNNFDCAAHKCKMKTPVACDGDTALCVGTTPICDAGTCVACDTSSSTQMKCPMETHCDAVANSPTKGGCVSGTVECLNNDSDACKVGAPSGKTRWCNEGKCQPCTQPEQCGEGGSCDGAGYCTPGPVVTRCDKPDDCLDDQACVNNRCTLSCDFADPQPECGHGRVCVKAEGSTSGACVPPVPCTEGNNLSCTGASGYNGLACVGGSPGQCRNCGNSSQCASSLPDRTSCINGLCEAPGPTGTPLPLGSVCISGADCESGFCFALKKGSGSQNYASLCTSVCSRTQTTSNMGDGLKDCPTAASGGANNHRGNLLPLEVAKGFRCSVVTESMFVDNHSVAAPTSSRICLHATDWVQSGASTASPVAAFTLPGGLGNAATEPLVCQASFKDPATGPTNAQVCAYRCGASSDCPIGSTNSNTNYSCGEQLAQGSDNPNHEVGIGTTSCVAPKGDHQVGQVCTRAAECTEQMCDGECVARQIKRVSQPGEYVLCPNGTCADHSDVCVDEGGTKYCYRSAETGGLCVNDGGCHDSERCFFNRCYLKDAITSELCQDSNGCSATGDPAYQFCAGHCAKHCNGSDACESDPAMTLIDHVVCGLRPTAPGNAGLTGQAWARVCRTKMATGTLPAGSNCTSDLQCKSEICQLGLDAPTPKCRELCGFASKCPSGTHCQMKHRLIAPTGTKLEANVPVCL